MRKPKNYPTFDFASPAEQPAPAPSKPKMPILAPSLAPVDVARVATLLQAVLKVMRRGEWLTLAELQNACEGLGVHGSEAGLSARLRDLRKPQHGGLTVERRRRGEPAHGLFEYRLMPESDPYP